MRAARPKLLESIAESRPLSPEIKVKKIVLVLLVIAIITGGIVSWFASSNPDGLEWAIERVYRKPELPEQETGIVAILKAIQERTAFLPNYTFKKKEAPGGDENAWPNVEAGTSVSGILGSIMMVGLIFLVGFGIKAIRKKGT